MKSAKTIAALFAAALLLLPFAACRKVDRTVYSKYADIGPEGWNPAKPLVFFPEAADSAEAAGELFSVVLRIRYAENQPLAPLRLAYALDDNLGTQAKGDTVALPLFSPVGKPIAPGAHGVHELADTIASGVRLKPGLCVILTSLTPRERTQGISEIGISLVEQQ